MIESNATQNETFNSPVVELSSVDGINCEGIIDDRVGCTGSGFGGDEKIVSQHSRSGNSLPFTQ